IIEGEHKVTRETVEEYFGSDKYQCSCFAWTSRGHIRSQPATIEIALTFRCEPPPAAPFVQLYWLKNGAPVVIDDNVHMSKDGNLLIKQASL
ncbi:Unc-5, partial [Operophtera brumata]